MIRIAIFGHSPDAFPDIKSVAYHIDNAIALIKQQHQNERDLIFLVNATPGVGQWVCNSLNEKDLPYEVYLSSTPEHVSLYWSEEQRILFSAHLNKARVIHIVGSSNELESCIKRDRGMIEASQWTLVYWNGRHQGITYSAMEYAIKTNKIVYNGIDGLQLLSSPELRVIDERLHERQ